MIKVTLGSTKRNMCNYELSSIMLGKEIRDKKFLYTDERLAETELMSSWLEHIPNGWSGEWEGPATDGRQSDRRDLQTTGACRAQRITIG